MLLGIASGGAFARGPRTSTRSSEVQDRLLAVGCGLLALLVYARTMYPGLAGVGSASMDAPKFQFLGHVLGTAHNPGYPLYVVLTHVFGWLPIGRLAWRMNLFSAVCAALAVGLMYLVARRLRCGRPAAIASCLGLAFGGIFWAQATIAEVYGLAAALQAVSLLGLVTWSQTRRFRWLLLAMAATGLSLGHHLTVATVAPALVAFVVLADWRTACRPRVLVAAIVCIAVGLAQYGFILLRSRQGAPYLESRATSLWPLFRIVSGQSFAHSLFVFGPHALAFVRAPLIAGMLLREIGWLGAALVVLGVVTLLRGRRWADAALVLGGVAGSVFFAANYDVTDLEVFLLPAIVLLWPLAGVGLDRLAHSVESGAVRRLAVLVLAAAVPCTQFVRNYSQSDHHDHVLPAEFFDALFARLPESAAIVGENYSTDMEVQYMLLGEEQRRHHRLTTLRPDQANGLLDATPSVPLFAFRSGTRTLASQGYVFSPMRLLGPSLAEHLASISWRHTVVLAASGPSAAELGKLLRPDLSWLGVESFVFVGRGGGPMNGTFSFGPQSRLRATAHGEFRLEVTADQGRAEIMSDGESLAIADDGAALLVAGGGRVREAEALFGAEGWRMPLVRKRIGLVVNRLVTRAPAVSARSSEWVAIVPTMPSSRMLLWAYPSKAIEGQVGEMTIYVAGGTPTAPKVVCDGGGVARVESRVFDAGEKAFAVASREDTLPERAFGGTERVARLHLAMSDFARHRDGYGCRFDLDGVTSRGWVRSSSKIGVNAYLVPAGGIALSGDELFWLPLGSGEDAPYLGAGWQPGSHARELLIPFARPVEIEVRFRIRGSGTVVLRWNGQTLPGQALTGSWRSCSWKVPRGMVRSGTNEVDVLSDGAIEVSSLRITPAPVP